MCGRDFPGGVRPDARRAISRPAYCKPFLPERIDCERQTLGDSFVSGGTLWHATGKPEPPRNADVLRERAAVLVERLATRLAEQAEPRKSTLTHPRSPLYEGAADGVPPAGTR